MSLEEPESCDAEGLQEALTAATGRMNFSFPRSQKELGMCSDGASVNVRGTWSTLYTGFVPFTQSGTCHWRCI